VSRRVPVVRVKVKVPGVRNPDPSHELRQPSYDSVDQEGNLTFVIELGFKATLFILVLVVQILYVYHDPLFEAFNFVRGVR
jgi:hypothetical protein